MDERDNKAMNDELQTLSLKQIKDQHLGVVGTDKRDKYETNLNKEIIKDNIKIIAPYVLTECELEIIINDRVIDELMKIRGIGITYTDDVIDKRIKELKQ